MRSRDLLRRSDEEESESSAPDEDRPQVDSEEKRVVVRVEIVIPSGLAVDVSSKREPEKPHAEEVAAEEREPVSEEWRAKGVRARDLIRGRHGGVRIPSVVELGMSLPKEPQPEKPEVREAPSVSKEEEPSLTEDLLVIATELEQGRGDEASAERLLRGITERLEGFIRQTSDGKLPDVDALIPLAEQLVKASRGSNLLLRKMMRGRSGKDPMECLAVHMVDVAVLTIPMGMELSYDQNALLSLVQSALLHDIGWIKLPPELFRKNEPSEEELELIRRHPILGYEIVADREEQFPWLAKVVLQEHERDDGSGYPHGVKGPDIHEFAKIVGISDTYEMLIHVEGIHPYRALQQVLTMRDRQFPSKLVKTLLQVLSVFPLESLVRLNTGEVARVVDVSKTHPTRPTVELLLDAQGEKIRERRRVNLAEEPIVYIADPAFSIEGIEIE
ncbi:MAG: hypothetical protein DRP95_03525 [Candidatus Latescibacterota bacterium]|nr:MAG: hypothetical protein DRP95_03525 [Candidatus Latescibacterota bacterium]